MVDSEIRWDKALKEVGGWAKKTVIAELSPGAKAVECRFIEFTEESANLVLTVRRNGVNTNMLMSKNGTTYTKRGEDIFCKIERPKNEPQFVTISQKRQ